MSQFIHDKRQTYLNPSVIMKIDFKEINPGAHDTLVQENEEDYIIMHKERKRKLKWW